MCPCFDLCVLELRDKKPKTSPVEALATRAFTPALSTQCAGPFSCAHTRRGGHLSIRGAGLVFPRPRVCTGWGSGATWAPGPSRHQTHVSRTAVVVESDFVKYEGKFENHVSGAIETALGKVKLNVGGKGLVESQSSFGSLRKQEVDLQQLLGQAADR